MNGLEEGSTVVSPCCLSEDGIQPLVAQRPRLVELLRHIVLPFADVIVLTLVNPSLLNPLQRAGQGLRQDGRSHGRPIYQPGALGRVPGARSPECRKKAQSA